MKNFTNLFFTCLLFFITTFNAYADDATREYFIKLVDFRELGLSISSKTNRISFFTFRILERKYSEKCETLYGKEQNSCHDLSRFMRIKNDYADSLTRIGDRYQAQYEYIGTHSDTLQSCLSDSKPGEELCNQMWHKLSSDEAFKEQLLHELELSEAQIKDTYEIFMLETKNELTKIVQHTNEYSQEKGYDVRIDNIEEEINAAIKYVIDHR